jgi:hypothetical protein
MTKRELIIMARDSYVNALGFAEVNQAKNFIRYYGQAEAMAELAGDLYDLSESERIMLDELDELCLQIYYKIDAEIVED